jgi:hypothetical protein
MRTGQDVARWLRYDTEWSDIASSDRAEDAIAVLEKERAIIDAAQLVLLGWMGDGLDGGKAMREALLMLKDAFDCYEKLTPKEPDRNYRSVSAGRTE